MPTSYDAQTLNFYAAEAQPYLASRPETTSRHLPAFLARLKPNAYVLELGCGSGRDTEAMLSQGFSVDPTDGVAEIAAAAALRLGRAVRTLRFDELSAVDAYDAVWANASLHHVPVQALPKVLRSIYQALKPGGLHFANFKRGADAGQDAVSEGRDAQARYYSFMSLARMIVLYQAAGDWDVVEAIAYQGGGGFETKQAPWVAITVRAPAQ